GQCRGTTDTKGLIFCTVKSPVSGNVILRAKAQDAAGRNSYANRDVWVVAGDDWWYPLNNEDRMDVLPERKTYEPGETARLQVRMPFRKATALVTIEREGVIEHFVTELSGKSPVVDVPIRGHHAPNMFVSVLAVRGRDPATAPTALIDLGKPAYKLGIAELKVGWRAHALRVDVKAERETYKVRDKAIVRINVSRADGSPGGGGEVAVAAVDEGLLELRANDTWDLLAAMMGRRGAEVETATAQMQVIGKRHFGRKAVAPGGGGGAGGGTRELFNTLLAWHGRVVLDANGKATVEIPLNDSLTSFRIVAIGTDGLDRFGTGSTVIRATQDLMLFAGLPPVVRESDRYTASFTVRNASKRTIEVEAQALVKVITLDGDTDKLPPLAPQSVQLDPGQAREISWEITAPQDAARLRWQVTAQAANGAEVDAQMDAKTDMLDAEQEVLRALAVRTLQASLTQLDAPVTVPIARPAEALPERGDIRVRLQASLASDLAGVTEYMTFYAYNCLEQVISKAVALQDEARWQAAMALLPAYLDGGGFAKYFAVEGPGSDILTAYILALAAEAEWTIPESARTRMQEALVQFIEGRTQRDSAWPSADLNLRKLAAIEALSRYPEGIQLNWLDAIVIEPNLWPTSAVIDWIEILRRVDAIPDRERKQKEVLQILRSRLNFQGSTMTFSTESSDRLWWLMLNGDVNANRALLAALQLDDWAEDVPRLVTGSLGRQQFGHWSTTNANAWGVLAVKKFSERFEIQK
ncbi:MAG: alpha-2-macroglobulin family protein, partial [Gammaproteobacteria bacterium]